MLSASDDRYIRSSFVPLDEVCAAAGRLPSDVRELIATGRLPRPAYVLDDGTEMVASDYFALLDEAGDVDELHRQFVTRLVAAADATDAEAGDEWQAESRGQASA